MENVKAGSTAGKGDDGKKKDAAPGSGELPSVEENGQDKAPFTAGDAKTIIGEPGKDVDNNEQGPEEENTDATGPTTQFEGEIVELEELVDEDMQDAGEGPINLDLSKPKLEKSLGNTDISGAEKNVPDIVKFGNGDLFQLLSKASSKREGWMKSTKAMEIPEVGCVVQVTTQQWDKVAEALTFVPGVYILEDVNGGRKLGKREP